MPICYIVGAAEACAEFTPAPEDAVVAADGGLRHLQRRGIVPTLVIGDFDSLGAPPPGGRVLCYPVEKDDTDTMLALKWGWAQGFRTFCLLAGTGGRTDHTLANLQALSWLAARGGHGVLAGQGECFAVVRNAALTFAAREEGILSVFAWGGTARGVSLRGLQYPLEEGELAPDFPLGVSNHFIGQPAAVSVREGALLVCWQGTADAAAWR